MSDAQHLIRKLTIAGRAIATARKAGSVQALAATVHSVRCGRSRSVEKTCVSEREQRRGHSEAEIVLVTPWVLAAW